MGVRFVMLNSILFDGRFADESLPLLLCCLALDSSSRGLEGLRHIIQKGARRGTRTGVHLD